MVIIIIRSHKLKARDLGLRRGCGCHSNIVYKQTVPAMASSGLIHPSETSDGEKLSNVRVHFCPQYDFMMERK